MYILKYTKIILFNQRICSSSLFFRSRSKYSIKQLQPRTDYLKKIWENVQCPPLIQQRTFACPKIIVALQGSRFVFGSRASLADASWSSDNCIPSLNLSTLNKWNSTHHPFHNMRRIVLVYISDIHSMVLNTVYIALHCILIILIWIHGTKW